MSKRRDECLFDSGAVTFYRIASTEQRAIPAKWTLTEIVTLPIQERAVGYSHFYAAHAARESVDKAVRIWDLRNDGLSINTNDTLALVQGRYYRILKITPTFDPDGLPVLDLDLTDDDAAIRRKIATYPRTA